MTVDNQLTSAEMLVILAEAQAILDQATQFEVTKRERNRSGRLQAALEDCSAAAREAHQAASRRLEQSRQTIGEVRALLLKALPAQVSSPEADETRQGLEEQIANMEEEHERLRREVERKAKKLDTFNLTLFGRTMTGKSTLMEILTEGDGHTISKGAQRTSRDTRQIVRIRYEPNGEYGFNGERIPDNQRSDCTYRSVRGNHPTLGSFYPCPVPGGALRHQSRTGAKGPPAPKAK